jgi:hypothetical protein
LLAEGLDDLEVLANRAGWATTLEAHEHGSMMPIADLTYKNNRSDGPGIRTTTSWPAVASDRGQIRDSAAITTDEQRSNCRK